MGIAIKPYFSILIPVFNRSFELQRALISLKNQTLKNFEVIVCDDGSEDDIFELVDFFNDQFQINYIKIENSGGPAKPRNEALKLARGDWICFLDSDDCWDSNRMQEVSGHITDHFDFYYHVMRTDSTSNAHKRDYQKKIGKCLSKNPFQYLATNGNFIPNSSVIVKKSILLGIGGICEDPKLRGIEDYDTWLRILEAGGKVKFINKCLGTYWFSPASLSVITTDRIRSERFLYRRHRYYYLSFKSQARAFHFYTLGTLSFKLRDKKNAIKYFLCAKNLASVNFQCKRFIKISHVFFLMCVDKWLKK